MATYRQLDRVSPGARQREPGPGSAVHAGVEPTAPCHPLIGLQRERGNRYVQRLMEGARSGGRPLDGGVGARMRAAFGIDFSAVRVHTDARADALNRTLNACASTLGTDIYFRAGTYRPASAEGTRLLAHELTHVVQQGAARSRAGLVVGAAHAGPEREAESSAGRVAAGQLVDAGRLTPVTGAVVQRRYLDTTPQAGFQHWVTDTTVKKGLTEVSRTKLTYVDGLLRSVLNPAAKPNWPALLPQLDTALQQTKYGQPGAKTSKTFMKRSHAVQVLRQEIHQEIQAAAAPPPKPLPAKPPKVAKPKPGLPSVTALQNVGFVKEYLEGLPVTDLQRLYQADRALATGQLAQAQALFDQLNPPTPFTGTKTAVGWADEDFEPSAPPGRFDFARTSDRLMAAQRQLVAYHAADIGGEYATMLSYKPYKAAALTPVEIAAAQRYFTNTELRDWDTLIEMGYGGTAELYDAIITAAPDVAHQATLASQAKGKVKPAKEALTAAEVTALRIYTADEYREMNAVFRDFRVDQPTANWAKYSAIAKLAISGLGKLPKARGAISYRGDSDINFGGHAGVLKLGATFRLPNFYSTTKQPHSAFAGDLGYVFHNKKAGRVIEAFSAFLGEAEILIPPGAAFKIIGEWHLQLDGSWLGADGSIALSPDVAAFHANDRHKNTRKMYLELDEV